MADSTEQSERGTKRSLSDEAVSEKPNEDKKLKVEEPKSPPKQYREIRRTLRSLSSQISRSEQDVSKIIPLLKKLEDICSQTVHSSDSEVPTAVMTIQMYLKHAFFASKNIKDEDNIKNFLSGLEDGSASKSDKDDSMFVFLANHATELWYRWDKANKEWQWTPDSSWMPCSSTVVSEGQWEGETPAPENVEIINYLDAVRPAPSDEVYLSDSFDVAQLLVKLAALEDVEANGKVVAIATALKDQDILSEDKGGYLKVWRETLAKLVHE